MKSTALPIDLQKGAINFDRLYMKITLLSYRLPIDSDMYAL